MGAVPDEGGGDVPDPGECCGCCCGRVLKRAHPVLAGRYKLYSRVAVDRVVTI